MQFRTIVPVLAATFAISGLSAAEAGDKNKRNKERPHHSQQMQNHNQNRAVSVGAGSASASRRGAEASGVIASGAVVGDRCAPGANTATTFGAGATFTDRRTASAAGSTGCTASGTGSVGSTSEADVYSTTDRNGSDAGAYAASSAAANEAQRRPRGC